MDTLYKDKALDSLNSSNISWISLRILNNDYTAFIENDLPTPTHIQHTSQGYIISWGIDGFFGTKKGRDYYNDIKDKVSALFSDCEINEHIKHQIKQIKDFSKVCEAIYLLSDFNDIQDKRITHKRDFKKSNDGLQYQDKLFELSRFKCYDLKLENRLTWENVYDVFYTMNRKYDLGKTNNDIKMKTNNVYEWVKKNYNPQFFSSEEKIKARRITKRKNNNKNQKTKLNDKDKLMTRSENAKLQSKKVSDDTKKLISDLVTILIGLEYKKGTKWNVSKIANDLNLSRPTVKKYIDELIKDKVI